MVKVKNAEFQDLLGKSRDARQSWRLSGAIDKRHGRRIRMPWWKRHCAAIVPPYYAIL